MKTRVFLSAALFLTAVAIGSELACVRRPPALVITGQTLHAAALTFQGTAIGMAAANAQGLLTADQVRAWNTFLPKFKAGFHSACEVWRAAVEAQDDTMQQQAAAIIAALLAELAGYAAMLATSPDAGVVVAGGGT